MSVWSRLDGACKLATALAVPISSLIGIYAIGRQMLLQRSGQSLLSSCPDFNASCVPFCEACHRLARSGCSHCERLRRPKCVTPKREAALNASAELHQRQALRWLHFPKCGSTLAISILAYACPEQVPAWHAAGMALRGGRVDVRMAHALRARSAARGVRCGGRLRLPFDGHRPVSLRDKSGLVAMFRRPAQRLISAYLDNYHAWGLPREHRMHLKARAPTIAAFARYPGIAGCMTKMLAGHQCAEPVDLTDGRILRAALAVLQSSRFAFIGLAEEWSASICLLHRMLPGLSQPILAEFRHLGHSVNSHRDIDWLPNAAADGEYNESVLAGFVDEADEQVYAEAARIFRRNLGRHSAALAGRE